MRASLALAIMLSSAAGCATDVRPPLPALTDAPLSLSDVETGEHRELALGHSGVKEDPLVYVQLDNHGCGTSPYPGAEGPVVIILISPEDLHEGEVEASVAVHTLSASTGMSVGVRSRVVLDVVERDRIAGRVSARDDRYTIAGAFSVKRCSAPPAPMDAGLSRDAGGTAPEAAAPIEPEGCAIQFAAPGSALQVDDATGLFADEFTAELWARIDAFNPDSQAPQHFLALEGHGPIDVLGGEVRPAFYMGVWGEQLGCRLISSETAVSTSATIPVSDGWLGQWHHVACTLAPGVLTLWIDGEAVAYQLDPHAIFEPGYPLVFGGAPDGTPYQTLGLRGSIDEVRISASALHPFRVEDGPRVGGDSFVPEARATLADDTRALWHFDECEGTRAANSAGDGQSFAGTLVGDATWLPAGP